MRARSCQLDPCRRPFSLVGLAVCVAAAACSDPAPAARTSPDAAALFAQACAKCHAADGSGGLPTATSGPRPVDLTAASWQAERTDQEIVTAIRSGRGAMPPFDGVLRSEQIDALGAYVRSLRRPD